MTSLAPPSYWPVDDYPNGWAFMFVLPLNKNKPGWTVATGVSYWCITTLKDGSPSLTGP